MNLSFKEIIEKNFDTINTCQSNEEKIKKLKTILEQHYTPYISMHDAKKQFNIETHILRYSIENEKIKTLKIGRRVLIKTSTVAPIIFSKNKNLF